MNQLQKSEQEKLLTVAHNNHAGKMTSYAYFKMHSKMAGQDLVQDTFMKTWAYIVRGGKIEMMKPFLYRILNNLIIDEYRKHKTSSLDTLLETGFDPGFDPRERALNVFDGKAALHLLQSLPEKYRRVMYMKYKQDLSIEEIALITGQSKNTVAVQTHRGLAILKKMYRGM